MIRKAHGTLWSGMEPNKSQYKIESTPSTTSGRFTIAHHMRAGGFHDGTREINGRKGRGAGGWSSTHSTRVRILNFCCVFSQPYPLPLSFTPVTPSHKSHHHQPCLHKTPIQIPHKFSTRKCTSMGIHFKVIKVLEYKECQTMYVNPILY
jgi:hypothetical protein